MNDIEIKYTAQEIKVMVSEILAHKLYADLSMTTKNEIMREAKDVAIREFADRIGKELAIV